MYILVAICKDIKAKSITITIVFGSAYTIV